MRRTIVMVMVLAAVLLGLVGCGSTETPAETVVEVEKQVTVVVEKVVEVEKAVAAAGSVQLTGAGASFPYPLYSRWFYEYAFVNPVPASTTRALAPAAESARSQKRTLTLPAPTRY